MRGFLTTRAAVLDWLRTLGQQGVRKHSLLAFEDFDAAPAEKPFRASACVQPPGKKLSPNNEQIFRFNKNENGEYQLTPSLDERQRILAGTASPTRTI